MIARLRVALKSEILRASTEKWFRASFFFFGSRAKLGEIGLRDDYTGSSQAIISMNSVNSKRFSKHDKRLLTYHYRLLFIHSTWTLNSFRREKKTNFRSHCANFDRSVTRLEYSLGSNCKSERSRCKRLESSVHRSFLNQTTWFRFDLLFRSRRWEAVRHRSPLKNDKKR